MVKHFRVIFRKGKTGLNKGNGFLNDTSHLRDPDNGLYIPSYFLERLCFERRRAERSKMPVVLMLLNMGKFSGNEKGTILKKITLALFSTTREIDIKGWYEHDHVIGVLFSQVNEGCKDSVRKKISRALCECLDPDEMRKIEITIHVFPERKNDQNQDHSPNMTFYPDLLQRNASRKFYFFMKRLIDIVGSLCGLVIICPLFVVIPLFIKLSSEGPVIFKQERVGLQGNRFTFLKYRSMYVNNDPMVHKEYVKKLIEDQKDGGADSQDSGTRRGVYKITTDPRMTPIGYLLRKSSLDELPQILNVLKGDMSLVGPRPPIPYELERYDVWHKRRILEVKPGISGLWQVRGRSLTTFNEMVRLDLKYIRERSLWLDIKILLQTPWAVLSGMGAY